jgi:hypothetical protein
MMMPTMPRIFAASPHRGVHRTTSPNTTPSPEAIRAGPTKFLFKKASPNAAVGSPTAEAPSCHGDFLVIGSSYDCIFNAPREPTARMPVAISCSAFTQRRTLNLLYQAEMLPRCQNSRRKRQDRQFKSTIADSGT